MLLRTPSRADERRANGGVPARRAIARWSLRLFRREWRQQLLVLALLTVAVAAVIFGASAAYNATSTRASDFGTADLRITLDATSAAARRAAISAVTQQFGTVDVIGVSSVPVPGSVDTVEVRAQDPHGAYGAPMLALRAGRYPRTAGEVAVTDGVADSLRTGVGRVLELGRVRRTVVGLVENPGKLNDEFALESADARATADTITVLARGTPGEQCRICRGFSARIESSGSTERTRAVAARAGLGIEARDEQHGLATTRSAATLGGMLLALGVLAMTVGLIRSEAGRDLRTLTATGATSITRRTLTAVTAGALALLGVVLGMAAAYTALLASYLDDLTPLGRVPVAQLVVTAVGIPLAATIAGFLLAGGEPPAVARTAFD
jgi:putative ABC transport system permease protein